jgi:hypothetical protein
MLTAARSASTSATVSMTGTVPSMPILTAWIGKSSNSASSWARRKRRGGRWIAVTPRVFWAVRAAIALRPWQPRAMKALRSAWMPAPPPESEPAMVRTTGRGRFGSMLFFSDISRLKKCGFPATSGLTACCAHAILWPVHHSAHFQLRIS